MEFQKRRQSRSVLGSREYSLTVESKGMLTVDLIKISNFTLGNFWELVVCPHYRGWISFFPFLKSASNFCQKKQFLKLVVSEGFQSTIPITQTKKVQVTRRQPYCTTLSMLSYVPSPMELLLRNISSSLHSISLSLSSSFFPVLGTTAIKRKSSRH